MGQATAKAKHAHSVRLGSFGFDCGNAVLDPNCGRGAQLFLWCHHQSQPRDVPQIQRHIAARVDLTVGMVSIVQLTLRRALTVSLRTNSGGNKFAPATFPANILPTSHQEAKCCGG